MKTEKVLLSQVKVNNANPRSIKEHKLKLLMERLIVFPKMITLRPVVIDNTMVALGGNMRVRALNSIAALSINEIASIAKKTKNFNRITKAEQEALLQHWQVWLDKPTVEVAKASELTDAEKQEFVIADNASFGEWNYDTLANEWDASDLNSWGVDVWNPDSVSNGFTGFTSQNTETSTSQDVVVGNSINTVTPPTTDFDASALPPELQDIDVTPDKLPKIEGDDQTAMERVIIVYPKDRADELADFLRIEGGISKVIYNIDELL